MRVDVRTGQFTPLLGGMTPAPGPWEIILAFDDQGKTTIVAQGARVTAQALQRLMTMQPSVHPDAAHLIPEGALPS